MRDTLVIAQATQYPLAHFVQFVGTLRRHYDGAVTLLVSNGPSVLRYCEEHSVVCSVLKGAMATQNGWRGEPAFRFVRYAELCTPEYAWCFTTDFRDVYFQASPFSFALNLRPLPSLTFVAEYPGKPIRNCRFNKLRIAECYGWTRTSRIWDKPIINSGSYYGSPSGMRALRDSMVSQGCPKWQNSDQGMLNWAVHTSNLSVPFSVVGQGIGPVNTLRWVPDDVTHLGSDSVHPRSRVGRGQAARHACHPPLASLSSLPSHSIHAHTQVLLANVLVRNTSAPQPPERWGFPQEGGLPMTRAVVGAGSMHAVPTVLNGDGLPSAVVHQHDRKPFLWDPMMRWASAVARATCERYMTPPRPSEAMTFEDCIAGREPGTGRAAAGRQRG